MQGEVLRYYALMEAVSDSSAAQGHRDGPGASWAELSVHSTV